MAYAELLLHCMFAVPVLTAWPGMAYDQPEIRQLATATGYKHDMRATG